MAYKKTEQKPEEQPKQHTQGCEEHNCSCEDDCKCEQGENCNCDKDEKVDLANEYLNMARIIQADFDNYRKRSIESIKQAKEDGIKEAVEVILPCLDVFKKAKQMIKDANALKGIEMVEAEIQNSLKALGVEKIKTEGEQFNPNFHHALSVVEDKTKPDNQIVEEYKAGYCLGNKVIKYSQVIVNKLKEEK